MKKLLLILLLLPVMSFSRAIAQLKGTDTVIKEEIPFPDDDNGNMVPTAGLGIQGIKSLSGQVTNETSGGGHGTETRATFDVMNYGAKGDGSFDDTRAFQNCFNAAIAARGKVVIPAAPNHYKLTTTVVVYNKSTGQAWIDVEAWGWGVGQNAIVYYGPSGRPVFQLIGLKQGMWNGLKIGVNSGITGVTIFDVDTRDGANSTTGVTFKNMYLTLGDKANVGFRIGHISGGNGDVSNLQFENIAIYGKQFDLGGVPGQIAYLHEGRNSLSLTWIGGFVAHCDKIYTNVSGPGAKDDRGNGSVYFYGLGASQNNVDFEINFEQVYTIIGGRFEASRKFLHVLEGGGFASIVVQGTTIQDPQTNGNMIDLDTSCDLSMIGVHIVDTNYDDLYPNSIINMTSATRVGSLFVRGGSYSSKTLYTKSGKPQWDITVLGVTKAQGVWSNGFFPNEIGVRK